VLKGSYGTGFKPPTLSQLFVDFPAFGFFGNPNLKPEESTGYDIGFEQPLFNNLIRFGATYYQNNIKDLIDINETGTSFTNIGRAKTYGCEAFSAFTITPELNFRLDYTFTIARDEITGLELLRRPRNKLSMQAAWKPIRQAFAFNGACLRGHAISQFGGLKRRATHLSISRRITRSTNTSRPSGG
jgi:vitamin B12 transporter